MTVVIVCISRHAGPVRYLFELIEDRTTQVREVANINAYLIAAPNVQVAGRTQPLSQRAVMQFGNHPYYGGALIFPLDEARSMLTRNPEIKPFLRRLYGSQEFISGAPRACLWIDDSDADAAGAISSIAERLVAVRTARCGAKQDKAAQKLAKTPYRFRDNFSAATHAVIVPRVSSENRPYLPVGILGAKCVVHDRAFALYDAPLWNLALIASRLHWVWIGAVCARMRTDFSYSNTLGWNTFPVPPLTGKNMADLARCAEDILVAREAHFPHPSPTFTIQTRCRTIFAWPTNATMKCSDASTLAAASETTRSDWKSCSRCIPR